jgi:hypothetical protein
VVSYLAMGAPAVLGGFLAVHNGDVLLTTREYGAAVILLAVLAAVGLLRRPSADKQVAEPAPVPRARELCETA